jgi:YbbR domain-containing protein
VLEEVPITVTVEKGIAVLDQRPKTVSVSFRGSSEDLLRLDRRQVQVAVRPRASSEGGTETVELDSANVRHGAMGVRVMEVKPPRVSLVFDREIRKSLPVAKPEITGTPLIGKVEIDYAPRSVTVRGPKRTLETERFVTTAPVDVEGRAAEFWTRVPVLPPSTLGVLEAEPKDVLVRVNFVKETVNREWTNVVLMAVSRGGTPEAVFEPAAVNVSLHGSAEALDGIAQGAVKAFVDCEELDPARTHERPVIVHVPAGLNVTATVAPARVKVTFVAPAPPAGESEPHGEREQSG